MHVLPSCVLIGTEQASKEAFDKMMAGDNHQPCFVCEKKVKAEYCFCPRCGLILCDDHMKKHRGVS